KGWALGPEGRGEAPVTSAGRLCGRPPLADVIRSSRLGEQRQLDRDLARLVVGEGDRVIAGKAGVAEPGCRGIAARLAHRAVEPVDRDEGEAVGADETAPGTDVVATSEA